MTERRIIDDATFPNEWPKVGEHEGHEIRKKEGVSKEMGVHGVAVAVDFDICIADGICISVCPVNVFDKMDFPAEKGRMEKRSWTVGKQTQHVKETVSSAERAKFNAQCKLSRSPKA